MDTTAINAESHSYNVLLYRLYQASVAAAFPVPEGGNASEIARLEAEEALDTARVHMLVAIDRDLAYYIAADSKELASLPNFATPLAVALPNHPDHKGDGAYRHSFGEYAAAVIRTGDRLRLIVGFKHEVTRSIEEDSQAGIVIHDVSEQQAVRLQSESWLYHSLADKTSRATSFFSLTVLGLAVAVAMVSNAMTGYHSAGTTRSAAQIANEAAALIAKAKLTQPLGDQLVRLIETSKAAVESGGWIDSYVYQRESGEAFTLSLPGWVTSEAISKIDPSIKTNRQPNEVNMIWARKPDLRGAFAPGPGPQQVEVRDSRGATAPKPAVGSASAPATK